MRHLGSTAVAALVFLTAFPCGARADFLGRGKANDRITEDLIKDLGKAETGLAAIARQLTQQRYEGAIEALRPYVRDQADDERVWLLLSLAHLGRRELPEALTAARRSVAVNPKQPAGHWLQAAILTAQHQHRAAFAAYDRAVAVAPTVADGYLQRGWFRVLYLADDRRHLRAAIDDLSQALRLGAPADAVHGYLGLAYRKFADRQRAERHFRSVLDASPNHPDAVRELTVLYIEGGKFGEAARLLAAARADRDRLGKEGRGMLSYAEALLALATKAPPAVTEKHFRAAVADRPADARVRLQYARWLDAGGRYADTVTLLRGGLQQAPFDPDVAAHLAWSLAEAGEQLAEARRWFAVARARYPDDPYLGDTGAWIEYRAGNNAAAWAALRPSLALAEKVPEVAYHAGAIQARLGDRTQAAHYLRLALKPGRPFRGAADAQKLLAAVQTPRR